MASLESKLSRQIAVRPTIVPALYAAGDAIGTPVKVKSITRADGPIAVIRKLMLTDKADQNAGIRVVLFDAVPTTAFADNAAFAPNDTDVEAIVGVYDFVAGSNLDLGGAEYQAIVPNSGNGDPVRTRAGMVLWAQFVVLSTTPTYASATDLLLRILVAQ